MLRCLINYTHDEFVAVTRIIPEFTDSGKSHIRRFRSCHLVRQPLLGRVPAVVLVAVLISWGELSNERHCYILPQ